MVFPVGRLGVGQERKKQGQRAPMGLEGSRGAQEEGARARTSSHGPEGAVRLYLPLRYQYLGG